MVSRHTWLFCSLALELFHSIELTNIWEPPSTFFWKLVQWKPRTELILLAFNWICGESQFYHLVNAFCPVFIQDYVGIELLDHSRWMWLVLWSVEDKAAISRSNWTLFQWCPWMCKPNLHNRFTEEARKPWSPSVPQGYGAFYGLAELPESPCVRPDWSLCVTHTGSLTTEGKVYCPPSY